MRRARGEILRFADFAQDDRKERTALGTLSRMRRWRVR
jgi:hypothetical protein